MLNNTNGYPIFRVVSEGRGLDYGLDVAVEKMFTKSYYVLVTGLAAGCEIPAIQRKNIPIQGGRPDSPAP
jgi:hypothetical protein